MEKDMIEVIYIIVWSFIKPFLKLSTRRVDNPAFCFRGRIIEHYYRSKTLKLVTGMRKKPQNRAIEKGMPIEQVQKILGHEQIDTTLRYAMVNQNNVKLSHRKYIS